MYAVHCVFAGLSYMLMHIFKVGVGMTFSGGLIDMTLFGILQGNAKTNWIWIVVVGVVYFVLYYAVFRFMITKFNLKTPGRESDDEETKLYTRSDVNAKKDALSSDASGDTVSPLILAGLGGKANLSDLDCCATRLRVTVIDEKKVRDELLKQSGASGIIHKGNGVQVIYGPKVSVIKSKLEDYMETPDSDNPIIDTSDTVKENTDNNTNKAKKSDENVEIILSSHMTGTVVPLSDVDDEAFSGEVLGKGGAIEPAEGKLYAPADGVIENLFDTHHAVGIMSDSGVEILLHIGIDTVKLGGKYFEPHVQNGMHVKKGDLLISFDADGIKNAGYKLTTPMIVCNTFEYGSVELAASGSVTAGSDLIKISN
jgi:PTS system D-glucosamine-specific IIC component